MSHSDAPTRKPSSFTDSACEIAGAIAAGQTTPHKIAMKVLERIDEVEDRVRAFSQFDREHVERQGEDLTAEATAGRLRGPLHGVPVAIKEWFDVEDYPTRVKGADSPRESRDATVVARLRAAGALIVGKTHVPIDGVPPPTRNPWNLAHTPGGSSSGSAAAVAAGIVPLAVAEQTGGSILRPAAFCGLPAIKPTYGTISRAGCFTGIWSRDHPGLIGLDMTDLALALSVAAGHDPRDPTTIERPGPPADLDVGTIRPPRIGVVRNFFPEITEPEGLSAVERGVAGLRDSGADVVDVRLPEAFGVVWDAIHFQSVESATAQASRWETEGLPHPGEFDKPASPASGHDPEGDAPRALLTNERSRLGDMISAMVPGTYYLQARRIRTWLTGLVIELMSDLSLDALLTAAAPGEAPEGLTSTGNSALLIPWSFLGLPAITVNAGLSERGLPLGIQLVGTPRADHSLLRVGHFSQQSLGYLQRPELA